MTVLNEYRFDIDDTRTAGYGVEAYRIRVSST